MKLFASSIIIPYSRNEEPGIFRTKGRFTHLIYEDALRESAYA